MMRLFFLSSLYHHFAREFEDGRAEVLRWAVRQALGVSLITSHESGRLLDTSMTVFSGGILRLSRKEI